MHVEVIEGMCTRMHEAHIPGRRRAHVSLDQSNLTGSGGVRLGLRLASAAAVNNTPRLPPTGRCVLPRPLVRGGRRCEAERGPPLAHAKCWQWAACCLGHRRALPAALGLQLGPPPVRRPAGFLLRPAGRIPLLLGRLRPLGRLPHLT